MDSRSGIRLLARFNRQFPRRAREAHEAPGPSCAQDQRPGAIPNHHGKLKHYLNSQSLMNFMLINMKVFGNQWIP